MEKIALAISIILFIIGMIGTLLPILPGAALVYIGMLVYGLMTKFETLSLYFFILQALVLIVTFLVDYISTAASTKRFGGSKQAAFGAVIGTIFGLVILGPLGIILGPFLGASAAELLRGIDMKQAIRSGFGSIVGVLGGTIFKLFAEILMIVYFFIKI